MRKYLISIHFFLCFVLFTKGNSTKPNIVCILVDDLGYSDLSSYGGKDIQTPVLDKLIHSGMQFTQFYSNCTVCTPTRASLMTGRYPDLVGTPGVIRQKPKDNWGHFSPTGPTLPELLKTAGYDTGMIGKWHLGYESPNLPNDRGFDHFHGFLGDMMDDYWTHLRGGINWMRLNKKTIVPKGHATEIFSQWAIEFISEKASNPDKPFFLYLAYNAPHFPIQPPQEWLEKVQKREPQLDLKRTTNVAFVEHLDHEIGRVLDAIGELGIEKDTLVVFSSDNGGSIAHGATNHPWRGGKQDHWEGGTRVPTCAVWPGKIPPAKSEELGMTMDLMPTFADLAGIKVDHEIDGKSLVPIWLEGKKGDRERTLIWVRREGNFRHQGRCYYAIRQGDWKLLQNHPFEPMQLVNLRDDPEEQKPLPASHPQARKLMTRLMAHIQKAGNKAWQK
ncbi:MAG: sulfatase-like hydrolase/transferase [Opitutae bacterium]